MDKNRARSILGTVLVITLVLMTASSATMAGTAVFQGKVVAEDGLTPVEGVVISIALEESGSIYDSSPSAKDGAFRLETVPEGEYEVLARHNGVGYLAAEGIDLEEGTNKPVAIVIRTAPANTTVSQLPMWGKVAIGVTIGILALAVFDETGEEGNDSITPF